MYVAEVRYLPEGKYEWAVKTCDIWNHPLKKNWSYFDCNYDRLAGTARTAQRAMEKAAYTIARHVERDVLKALHADWNDCPPDAKAEV